MHLSAVDYWQFRALSSDVAYLQARADLLHQQIRQKEAEKAAWLSILAATYPEFDRTLNYTADDATCTIIPVARSG